MSLVVFGFFTFPHITMIRKSAGSLTFHITVSSKCATLGFFVKKRHCKLTDDLCSSAVCEGWGRNLIRVLEL